MQEIYDIVQLKKSDKNKISDIKNRINDYTNNEDFCSLLSVIKEFTEIERHFIHGLSHSSTAGMPEFQQKEMKASILLLKKFEQGLKGLKGGLVQWSVLHWYNIRYLVINTLFLRIKFVPQIYKLLIFSNGYIWESKIIVDNQRLVNIKNYYKHLVYSSFFKLTSNICFSHF